MEQEQLDLPFDSLFAIGENPALWTPRDIWVRLNQRLLEYFKEDRRFERKGCKKIHHDELAEYYSTFSNTPDGGMIVYGIEDNGDIVGCNSLSQRQLNEIEKAHLTRCPQSRPELKRVSVVIGDKADFCVAIFIPYIGRLVENNKGDAWIRYGDSKHKMSEAEKQDFRSTRQELSFELEIASAYEYPKDFDLRIIQDFCDAFRAREGQKDWTNEEVLIDRHLLRKIDSQMKPLNSLILLAARDPRLTIPGSRVRIQRFGSEQEGFGPSYSPQRDRTVEGNLVTIIRDAAQVIADTIYDVTWLNNEGKFVTTPEYPQWAWFEALVNACVHRSYSFSGMACTRFG
jgi:ATP-dependent DNA helicase RecG